MPELVDETDEGATLSEALGSAFSANEESFQSEELGAISKQKNKVL